MPYPTLLVHMGLGQSNDARLSAVRHLAERLDAMVIGAAACDPQPPVSFDGIYPADVIQADRSFAEDQLSATEAEFRRALKGRENRIEWRSAFTAPAPYVARQSRAADLVITGHVLPDMLTDSNWRLDPGDLVMRAGRPVLLVPEAQPELRAKKIVIAWKDNRESRRAVQDALPLVRLAERVVVASIAEEADEGVVPAGADDVVAWLHRHGVDAETRTRKAVFDPARQLRSLALEEGADILVAGAYGHSRTREWILGGVTHDLLTQESGQGLLLSH